MLTGSLTPPSDAVPRHDRDTVEAGKYATKSGDTPSGSAAALILHAKVTTT